MFQSNNSSWQVSNVDTSGTGMWKWKKALWYMGSLYLSHWHTHTHTHKI